MKEHKALTPRQEALAERALFGAILTLKSVEECRSFFRDLCTPAELQALADPYARPPRNYGCAYLIALVRPLDDALSQEIELLGRYLEATKPSAVDVVLFNSTGFTVETLTRR